MRALLFVVIVVVGCAPSETTPQIADPIPMSEAKAKPINKTVKKVAQQPKVEPKRDSEARPKNTVEKIALPKKPANHGQFLREVDAEIARMEKEEPEQTEKETNILNMGNIVSLRKEVESHGKDWLFALRELSRSGLRSLARLLAAKIAREDDKFQTVIDIVWTPDGEFANVKNYIDLMVRWTTSGPFEQDLVLRDILAAKKGAALPQGFHDHTIKMGLGSYLEKK